MLNYAILVAVAAAVLLMITGKFIDLGVERQTSVQSRATISLLQDIVTEGPFLMEDSQKNKLKLMIDRTKLAGADLTGCCDSVQYSYRFGVSDDSKCTEAGCEVTISGPVLENYVGSGNFDDASFCYTGFSLGVRAAANVPVNICEENLNKCNLGIARIETVDSPLAELSYWITQACSAEFDFSKRIPLSESDYKGEDSITVDNAQKKVCLGDACKKFYCDKSVSLETDSGLWHNEVPKFPLPEHCHIAKVVKEGGVVTLFKAVKGV